MTWTTSDIGDLDGRVAVVTGSNAGIGNRVALHLAKHGAEVVLACRSVPKAEAALADLRVGVPDGRFTILPLDLADLASVRRAAEEFRSTHDRLDLLVNNAGIALAKKGRTVDGFESHLGTNYLGHFALTGLLLDPLLAAPAGRVVHVASLQHRLGRVDLTDLNWDRRRYISWNAYGQSKVANLLFMGELDRRLSRAGARATSVGAHPGVAGSNIADGYKIRQNPTIDRYIEKIIVTLIPTPDDAAQPILYAATSDQVIRGSYTGPSELFEVKGPPAPARLARRAQDAEMAGRLWDASVDLTGVDFGPLA